MSMSTPPHSHNTTDSDSSSGNATDSSMTTPRKPLSRVKNACQFCKTHKVACTDERPCVQCIHHGVECIATQRKKRRSNLPKGRPLFHCMFVVTEFKKLCFLYCLGTFNLHDLRVFRSAHSLNSLSDSCRNKNWFTKQL